MKQFKQLVYTDLEYQQQLEKQNIVKLETIKFLVDQYPNDADLGAKIREVINQSRKNK